MPNRVLRDWTCSEIIDQLSEGAEVFFIRLIMKVDDFGCYHGNPKLIKSALFPLKEIKDAQIEKWLAELSDPKINRIQCYTCEGKRYLKINDFRQRLRKMKSNFPQPEDCDQTVDGHTSDNARPETETEGETETESEAEKKKNLLLCSLSEETELTDHEKIAFAFWKVFKKNILESGISKTATLDKVKLGNYTNAIRLMFTQDGRTKEEFELVWHYLNGPQSQFWKKNVVSTSKLRKQFERLFAEAKERDTKSSGNITQEYLKNLYQRLYGE